MKFRLRSVGYLMFLLAALAACLGYSSNGIRDEYGLLGLCIASLAVAVAWFMWRDGVI